METTTKTTFDSLKEAHLALKAASQRNELTDRLSEIRSVSETVGQRGLITASGLCAAIGAVAGSSSSIASMFSGVVAGSILGGLIGFSALRTGTIYASGANGMRYAAIGAAALTVLATVGATVLSLGAMAAASCGLALFGFMRGGDLFSEAEVDRRVKDLQAKTVAERDKQLARIERLKSQVLEEVEELSSSFKDGSQDDETDRAPMPAE